MVFHATNPQVAETFHTRLGQGVNMEVQAIQEDQQIPLILSKHVPVPFMGRLVVGTIAGALAGLFAGEIAFDMEAAIIASLVLAPFFAVVGAFCGVISKRYGWARVSPLAWAIAIGIIFHFYNPTGWVIGGMLGGAINGVLCRSVARTAKGTFFGMFLGILAWAIVYGYIIGLGYAVNYFLG
jgi:hypothetical protein